MVSPILCLSMGLWTDEEKVQRLYLWLVTFVPQAFPISPTPVYLCMVSQVNVTMCG